MRLSGSAEEAERCASAERDEVRATVDMSGHLMPSAELQYHGCAHGKPDLNEEAFDVSAMRLVFDARCKHRAAEL